jgi:hypothetical protein
MAESKITYQYTLPSGAQIEIENVSEPRRGAGDVGAKTTPGEIPFQEVIKPLGEVTQLLFEQIKSAVHEPDSVTLEFAASLKGQTHLLLVSGEGEGTIKVSLTWNKAKN